MQYIFTSRGHERLSLPLPPSLPPPSLPPQCARYAIDQTGKPEMLFPGVGMALIAVISMSIAHAKLDASKDSYLVNGMPATDKSALLGGGYVGGGMKSSVGSSGGSLDTYVVRRLPPPCSSHFRLFFSRTRLRRTHRPYFPKRRIAKFEQL